MELEFRKFQAKFKTKWCVCVAQVGTLGLSLFQNRKASIQRYFLDEEPDKKISPVDDEPLLFSKEIVRWQ